MKRIVLIDGENLNRAIRNLLGSVEEPASREALIDFDYSGLIEDVLGDNKKAQVLFFGAKLRRYDFDEAILAQSTQAISLQSRLVNNLQKQGINFIKVGYLRARESKACPECGTSKWALLEKGVDVGLAVRMVTEAGVDTELVLFSADTDLLPAVNTAVKLGSRVVFVGYEYQPTLALAKAASVSRLITKPMIEKHVRGKRHGQT